MKIHILNCGYIRVYEDLLYGGGSIMTDFRKAVMAPESKRVTLPVLSYLIEHPAGLFLVDTGWSRDISPYGVYDHKAVRRVLPAHLAALYRPYVPTGMAVDEQSHRYHRRWQRHDGEYAVYSAYRLTFIKKDID